MAQNNWEADKMLDVYIYDHLQKKGLIHSAESFAAEANVSSDPVAINAPGGFLYEWWSVFWDIFISRTNEKHSDVAASYIETQRLQSRDRQRYCQQQQVVHNAANDHNQLQQSVSYTNGQQRLQNPKPSQSQQQQQAQKEVEQQGQQEQGKEPSEQDQRLQQVHLRQQQLQALQMEIQQRQRRREAGQLAGGNGTDGMSVDAMTKFYEDRLLKQSQASPSVGGGGANVQDAALKMLAMNSGNSLSLQQRVQLLGTPPALGLGSQGTPPSFQGMNQNQSVFQSPRGYPQFQTPQQLLNAQKSQQQEQQTQAVPHQQQSQPQNQQRPQQHQQPLQNRQTLQTEQNQHTQQRIQTQRSHQSHQSQQSQQVQQSQQNQQQLHNHQNQQQLQQLQQESSVNNQASSLNPLADVAGRRLHHMSVTTNSAVGSAPSPGKLHGSMDADPLQHSPASDGPNFGGGESGGANAFEAPSGTSAGNGMAASATAVPNSRKRKSGPGSSAANSNGTANTGPSPN